MHVIENPKKDSIGQFKKKKNMFFEFFVANICHFEKNILQNDIPCHKFPVYKERFNQKNSPKIAYNMKGCLRFSTFIVIISPKFG
jgi:hypothetical protein